MELRVLHGFPRQQLCLLDVERCQRRRHRACRVLPVALNLVIAARLELVGRDEEPVDEPLLLAADESVFDVDALSIHRCRLMLLREDEVMVVPRGERQLHRIVHVHGVPSNDRVASSVLLRSFRGDATRAVQLAVIVAVRD